MRYDIWCDTIVKNLPLLTLNITAKQEVEEEMAGPIFFRNLREFSLYLVGTSSFHFPNKFAYLNVWRYTTLQLDVTPRHYPNTHLLKFAMRRWKRLFKNIVAVALV